MESLSLRDEKKRNWKNYLAISMAVLGSQGLGFTVVNSFLSLVYTEYLALSAAVVGVVLSIGTIVDGLSDFGMGIVMDRFQTKYGKARHWFLWMAVPLALSCGLIFYAPANASNTVKVIYLVIMYNVLCTVLTATRLPANALTSLISSDAKVRSIGSILVAIWATAGGTITGWIINPIVNAFGGGLRGYRMLTVILGAAMGLLMLGAFFISREQASLNPEKMFKNDAPKISVIKQITYLLKNKYWIIQQGGIVFSNLGLGFLMGTVSYFCMYVLNDMNAVGSIFSMMTVPMLVGIFCSLPLTQKIDARWVAIAGSAISLVGCIFDAVFGLKSLTLLCVFLAVRMFGAGMCQSVDVAFTARVIEYGNWKNGIRQEGLSFCGKSVMQKISSALASAILGFVLSATGYVGGQGMIAESARQAIIVMFLYLPVIFMAGSTLCYCFFDLSEKKVADMQKEIEDRGE